MSGIIGNVRDIINLKLKARHDSYTDQYNRIFMVKMMFVGTILLGLNWYHDKIKCIVPSNLGLSEGFVGDSCWIQGFYIYEEVDAERDTVAYHGIPTNIDYDGHYENGKFCIIDTPRKQVKDEDCKPLTKRFFLQYQYLTFVLGSLSIMYYVPYMWFKMTNADMIALKNTISSTNDEKVIISYFDYSINSVKRMRMRVICTVFVKVLYVTINILSFILLNHTLNGSFAEFAINWSYWMSLENDLAHDYMGKREGPKPGNLILPTFGICEIHEGARDVRATIMNKHKFICEYSQHVLYHYVLIVLWFLLVFGTFVSVAGLVLHLLDIMTKWMCHKRKPSQSTELYSCITFREYEYLEYIRKKNLAKYKTIMEKLKEKKICNYPAENHQDKRSCNNNERDYV